MNFLLAPQHALFRIIHYATKRTLFKSASSVEKALDIFCSAINAP